MRIFISASLYPTKEHPQRGLFVQKRLDTLKKIMPEANVTLYIPEPYCPFVHSSFKEYTTKDAQHIQHFSLPLFGRFYNHHFLAHTLQKPIQIQNPSLLIAEYAYPDGLALAKLAKKFDLPLLITARGSDISYFLSHPNMQKKLQASLPFISHFIAVSSDMKQDLMTLGVPDKTITIIENGVDPTLFYPMNLPRQKKMILSVGGLIDRKGHDLAIQALSHLKEVTLTIVGEGPDKKKLHALAHTYGVSSRVTFTGSLTQKEIALLYNQASLFLLCSKSEGRANVLLEALACGTPILSSAVQGSQELIPTPSVGTIFETRDPAKLSQILTKMLKTPYDPKAIAQSVKQIRWDNTAQKYKNLIKFYV